MCQLACGKNQVILANIYIISYAFCQDSENGGYCLQRWLLWCFLITPYWKPIHSVKETLSSTLLSKINKLFHLKPCTNKIQSWMTRNLWIILYTVCLYGVYQMFDTLDLPYYFIMYYWYMYMYVTIVKIAKF